MRLGDLVQKKLSDIKPYENNTKNHPLEQIEQIANSIDEFGFADPILINEKGIIIAGHGRYEAGKKLKLKTVPTITIFDLTPSQENALRIAHNKLTINSGFDNEKLKLEVEKLLDDGFNLTLTGFTDDEFSQMLGKLSVPDLEIEDDDADGYSLDKNNTGYDDEDNDDYGEDAPDSEVRMMQLYLNDNERQELIDKIEKLNNHYNVDNPTACVLECVRECYANYC